MLLGPVMIDVAGVELSVQDSQHLLHPCVGGVILFSRNFYSVEQLRALVANIRALRQPPLLVAVDHEGGRVQRFRQGFARIPPMRALGRLWEKNNDLALQLAFESGWVLAADLRDCQIDFSFTPVLDIDFGTSSVIGDRAFHRDVAVISALADSLMQGLAAGGMIAVGKHFPGHGYVAEDSHLGLPVDGRDYKALEADMLPFRRLIGSGIQAIMAAHVVYCEVDDRPAGFSPVWLQQILRNDLQFRGVVFSDDLSMEGAAFAGDVAQRVGSALQAGCDMVLVCNRKDLSDRLLDTFEVQGYTHVHSRLKSLSGGRVLTEVGGVTLAQARINVSQVDVTC